MALEQNDYQGRADIFNNLQQAYDDLKETTSLPAFTDVIHSLQEMIASTEIQVINSDKEQDQPQYTRIYNILIGGTKLARGVTIENLLVTYYGRQPKSTKMDTMLQHARMYGYRQKYLNATRLFLTSDVEDRFRAIFESEQAMRDIVKKHPDEVYRGIKIKRDVKATRANVLNPLNVGAYGAGRAYFPKRPIVHKLELYKQPLDKLDALLAKFNVGNDPKQVAEQVTIDFAIQVIRQASKVFDPAGSGLWDTERIAAALETIQEEYKNEAYIVVRRTRNLGPSSTKTDEKNELGSVLSSGEEDEFAVVQRPTLFMYRNEGRAKWKDLGLPNVIFWIPVIRFPDGNYALIFNFD